MIFQNNHIRVYVSLIGSGQARHTTHLLKCVLLLSISQTDWKQSSDILSNISFDILSDISSNKASDNLSDILLSDTFCGCGPARNAGLTGSRLRSGAEHWPYTIAVEVRRGTLASQDRGWGPARNTELTATGSRSRSGAEY